MTENIPKKAGGNQDFRRQAHSYCMVTAKIYGWPSRDLLPNGSQSGEDSGETLTPDPPKTPVNKGIQLEAEVGIG